MAKITVSPIGSTNPLMQWIVTSDEPIGPMDALTAEKIPVVGTKFEDADGKVMIVANVQATQVDVGNSHGWLVQADYRPAELNAA